MSLAARLRQTAIPLAVACLAVAALASTAHAGVLAASATGCEEQSLSRPFLRWADPALYTPAPQGTFESGAGEWSLSGASVVSDNEPWQVAGDNGTSALAIAPGGVATTRAMCVGIEHPTIRFFAKRSGGSVLSTLRVDVHYENALGVVERLPIATVAAGQSWTVTAPYAIGVNLLPLLPGARTPVAFSFVPQGGASWRIDDVFVDPWHSR